MDFDGWSPEQPASQLPEDVHNLFLLVADEFYSDLQSNRLVVVLEDAPYKMHSSHKIRVVESENPGWYRKLYHTYRHFRRDRSLRALGRIRNGEDRRFRVRPYWYDFVYRGLILEYLKHDLINPAVLEAFDIPPDTLEYVASLQA